MASNCPAWLVLESPRTLMDLPLGEGERAAISLAVERRADLLLVDDKKARACAVSAGLRIMGTLGVFADQRGLIALPDVLRLIRGTDFSLSEELVRAALHRRERRLGGKGPFGQV